MTKILFIGMGDTAKAITQELLKNKDYSIYFISPNKEIVNGAKQITNEDKIDPSYVVLAFSSISPEDRINLTNKVKTTYDLRHAEFKENIKIINSYLPNLKKLKENTKIIVISNPIDELTNYLSTKLPNKEILGFGMQLDVKRFSSILGKKVDCVGLHGIAVPVINEKSKEKYIKLSKQVDKELFTYVHNKGIPAQFVGKEFSKFLKKLTGNKREVLYLCTKLTKPFGVVKNIAISLPWIVKNNKLVKIKNIKLNQIETDLLKNTISILKENLSQINKQEEK